MAVVITTKFYEEDTPAWHDLSKIVFTSPNIISPNTAGTRSHILPGKGDLALWYEDTSNMYEIEPIQDIYDTSLYYYHFTVVSGIDLDSSPTSALITAGNYSQFINFINSELNVEVIGFTSINSDIVKETVRLEYIDQYVSIYNLSFIYLYTIAAALCPVTGRMKEWVYGGWEVAIIGDIPECYIDFEFIKPTNITRIKMYPRYCNDCDGICTWSFIGNFKIQASDTGNDWVDLYTGSNTSNAIKYIFMTNNTDYYTYYRILVLNNDSIVDFPEEDEVNVWEKNHYAIAGLKFYCYDYSTDPGTGHAVLYTFDSDTISRELHVVNAVPVAGDPINTKHDTNTNVEGVINISNFLNGVVLTTRYIIDVDEKGASINYHTQASGNSVSPVVSGTTGATGTTGTTMISQDFGVLTNDYMDVVGETKIENGYIYSSLSGQQTDLTYSDNEYDITTDITYTTVISGAVVSGTIGDVAVIGYTNKYEDRDSAPRSEFYDISITDTVGTGIIPQTTILYLWEQKAALEDVEFSTRDSIVFEITEGEAYDCRLTAWDDVTHSTTINYLIAGDYVRVSALAFRSRGTVLIPDFSSLPGNYIASPIYNRIFKGNTVYEGTNYYYGDFDLSARTEPDMIGDFLIFKPMLYNIDETIPYGIHDHVIVLHYTYT